MKNYRNLTIFKELFMQNYRNLLTQIFLLVWLGMTCSYGSGCSPVDSENKMNCCAKYGPAGIAVASSVFDLVFCIGALASSEDDTQRTCLRASDAFSMVTFTARMGVLHSYITILHKEMNRKQSQITTDKSMQKVESYIFHKLSSIGLITAVTFIDIAFSMFAYETGLFSNEVQGGISLLSTLAVCGVSIKTLYDLYYNVYQTNNHGSPSSVKGRSSSKDSGSASSSTNKGSGSVSSSINKKGFGSVDDAVEMNRYGALGSD